MDLGLAEHKAYTLIENTSMVVTLPPFFEEEVDALEGVFGHG
jgi:hypothetical protein